MKQLRWLLGILILLLLSSCNKYETKTYVLEDLTEDEETRSYINVDRIYDYCYNVSTYGNEEIAKNKTAWWSPIIDRRIVINQYNAAENANYINKIDYEYGFSDVTKGRKWENYDKPLGVSPNGEYMFYERRLDEVRYLMLYDYMTEKDIMIAMFDNKILPPDLFEPVFSWGMSGGQLIYGWKYSGESKHVVALDTNYYYNNWRYGKERVYSIYCYNVSKQESNKIYEMNDWKFHNMLYNYSIQCSDNGNAMIYSNEDPWLYQFNILDSSKGTVVRKPDSAFETYWLGNKGIYVQDDRQGIKVYKFEDYNWTTIASGISDEIDHLITTKDGNVLYFSLRQKHEAYADYSDNNVWDIFRYRVDKNELECMYQGADDVIGLELSRSENNLMLEMRDYSYKKRYKDSLLTRIFVFKS